jgi:hypothetical protein
MVIKMCESTSAKVINVTWTPSIWYTLIPIVHIEETKSLLTGATINRVTAFNAKFILDNRIGPGAIVVINFSHIKPIIDHVIKPSKPSLPKNLCYVWDDNFVHISI